MKKDDSIEEWKAKYKLLSQISKQELEKLVNFLDYIADNYPETDKEVTDFLEIEGQLLKDKVGFLRKRLGLK